MIEKYTFDALLSKIRSGAVKVKYWDGTSTTYGEGKPYFTMTIRSPKAIRAIMRNMTVGFGESYTNNLIDIEGPLDNVGRLASENYALLRKLSLPRVKRRNSNTFRTQKQHVQHHYDLGNDFYKLWLDESMSYSCAYFQKPTDILELAQKQKVDYILRKLQLEPGMSLLDIGSGWGELLITAAKKYGVTGHGITLSAEQLKHSQARVKKEGLEKEVSFELISYNDFADRYRTFDRIVSVGMYEHVGRKNQASYFEAVAKMLKFGGISLLHTITNAIETPADPWIDKYIFPGGYIPSTRQVASGIFDSGFDLIDYENLRLHYAMTLDEWLKRFEENKDKVIELHGEKFYRMWRLYLAGASAGFRYGDLKLSQYTFSYPNNNALPATRDYLYK